MKKIDLGQTIAIFANIGVISGIVFLGLELQQNNALMDSQARRNRSAFAEQANLLLASDNELGPLVFRDTQGESLSALESFRAKRFWFAGLTNLETGFFDLSDDELEVMAVRWGQFFRRSSMLREVWAENNAAFDTRFAAWIDKAVLPQIE